MRRIALSAGHGNVNRQDMGSIGCGLIEGVENVKIRNRVKYFLETNFGCTVSIDPDDSLTGATVKLFKKYFSGTDIVIDIHLNAAMSMAATGTEVIIPAQYTKFEYDLGAEISAELSKVLGLRNRGVKTELLTPRKKLLWFTIPAETVLIECFFITNRFDVQAYHDNFDKMCHSIAKVIYKYAQK